MARKSTIGDIARELGVSKALVSFVLNGKSKEKRISDEMTAKVLEVARRLNYVPNYLAKSLREGKSDTLGLIVADISNPFFAKLARYVEIEASRFNYKVIFSNSDERKGKFASQLNILKNGQVDGFILTPPIGSEAQLLMLKKQKIPFVVVDRVFKGVDCHTVIIDNYRAGYDATLRLIKNNRKNIAVLNVNNQLIIMQNRVKGFKAALEKSGLKVNPSLIKHLRFSHEKHSIMKAIQEIIAAGADGLLFTTNKLGVLGIECLRELGARIPEDISVFSFDDTLAYEVSYTPISAIVQPLERMSKNAVRILMGIIAGKYAADQYEHIELPVDFVYRASCI